MKNFKLTMIGLLALVLGACGGGGGTITGTAVLPGSDVASIQIVVSSSELLTDQSNTNFVKISAVVRDANNNIVPGTDLLFSSTSGSIEEVDGGVTNASGIAEAFLKSFGNISNRTITVTVSAPAQNVSSTVVITVTGTRLEISGPANIAQGDNATLTLSLLDGNNAGIAAQLINLSSANGNTLPASAVTTGSGDVQVILTADGANGAADVITASIPSLNISETFTLAVSNDTFAFTSPAPNTEVLLIPAMQTLTMDWQQGGGPVPDGSTIEFTADRGTLSAGSATTVGGVASVDIDSTFAGKSTITATGVTLGAVPLVDGPTTQLTIEFVADTPDTVNVAAFPDNLISGEQATITAVVRDASGNRVKNIDVDFNITADPSGGGLTVSSDKTDSQGVATTVYTAGNTTTPNGGVVISATVRGTAISDTVSLTVSSKAINFVIGTGNDIFTISPTRFGVQYTVIATDVTGSPAAGEALRLTVKSWQYRKGRLVVNAANDAWIKDQAIFGAGHIDEQFCPDEDWIGNGGNENGSLDAGEDDNANMTLEAGNIATIVATECDNVAAADPGVAQQNLLTDAAGAVEVCVVYPQEYNLWLDVRLTATVSIDGGTENTESRYFLLPALAEDITKVDASPPGEISPFGTLACADGSGL